MFLRIYILLVNTVTAIYNMDGKVWSLEIKLMSSLQVHVRDMQDPPHLNCAFSSKASDA